jgi:hypothetical protein
MRPIAILVMVVTCVGVTACAPVPLPGQATAGPPACQSSTVPVTVGGQPEQARVEACPQPDGSWRITQTTPGLPPQVYVMPAPPPEAYPSAYPDYDYYFDYWPWAGPWFWGIGPSVVIVQNFHHFHHFDHFHPFDHFGHFHYFDHFGHGGPGHAPAPGFAHGAAGAPPPATGGHR